MNSGLDIKDSHDLETHLNLTRDFTGSLNRIAFMTSSGRIGSEAEGIAKSWVGADGKS